MFKLIQREKIMNGDSRKEITDQQVSEAIFASIRESEMNIFMLEWFIENLDEFINNPRIKFETCVGLVHLINTLDNDKREG